ncbi:hypothetical protein OSB04_un000326 [Centaurea solstitialis]|uniref:SWIM-type domain-containing protein n=1 Tax=Centaurea solstitialis TaxID=347529 RepID=A0AA38S4H2_9ASTR|nr:hypothetical protein OSB04_un000326 [Centaurea solstitialis]
MHELISFDSSNCKGDCMDYVEEFDSLVDGELNGDEQCYDKVVDGTDSDSEPNLHPSDEEDEPVYMMEESPGGTKYYVPLVDDSVRPKIGDVYESVDLAEKTYRRYAVVAGFDVHLSNKKENKDRKVTAHYYVCSKQGNPLNKMYDSLDAKPGDRRQRNSNIKRSGCFACFKVHYVKEKCRYELYKFIEKHNHMLFDRREMALSRAKRGLTYADQRNVFYGSTCKVGIANSHRMRNAFKGGVGESGPTVRDYHNFKRQMVNFVGNKDAQMLINTMVSRKKCNPDFFYEFQCNEKELLNIFWADETMRMNYREFGDCIAFDATFRTNQHAMVFVPFVAIDNHKRLVVVGVALMHSEKVPDYTWVLRAFLKAHGSEPTFVITDQCPSMKQVIPIVFPSSVHRLCMWHITQKVKAKIGVHMTKTTNFVPDFNKIVWDVHMDPADFEYRWNKLMNEYGLSGDSWFTDLRSTLFLEWFCHGGLKHMQCMVYTRRIFFEFQKEIAKVVWYCGLEDIEKVDGKKIYVITRKNKESSVKTQYKVCQDKSDGTVTCSCNFFIRNGILCRHALKVLINDGCDSIPDMYILRRWRRDLIPPQWMPARARYGEIDLDIERLLGSAFVIFERMVDKVRNEKLLVEKFVDKLTSMDDELDVVVPVKSTIDRNNETIQELMGVSDPDDVNIFPPSRIRNKGCGRGKRLVGVRDKAVEKAKKPKRMCRTCQKEVSHDSRNRPKRCI